MCIRDRELDDLALKYLQPDVYYDLVEKIALRKSTREEYVQSIVDEVQDVYKRQLSSCALPADLSEVREYIW